MKTIRYKDIPKLTSAGSYTPNIPLESLIYTIEEYISYGLNLNPDFQRGRVWSKKQSALYIEFLLRGGKTNNVIYFNQPEWGYNYEGDFVIVDGLQRLNACLDFMNNRLKVFEDYSYQDFEPIRNNIRISRNVDLVFNVNNLKTRKEVLTWYLEMNSGSTPHLKKDLDKVKELLKKEEE
jgi:hypothetical protein